jgi:hypothetical protein
MTRVVPISSVDIRITNEAWPFALQKAGDISAHWECRVAKSPELFNGKVALLRRWSVRGGHCSGECIQTDFKSFLYWRDCGYPDRSVFDFVPAAALHSREGWLLLGRSAPGMSNAGAVYPLCGTLHPDDFEAGTLDVDGPMIREVREEAGIALDRDQLGGAVLVDAGTQVAIIRPVMLDRPAQEIAKAISDHVKKATYRELSEIVIVRGWPSIDARTMPPFTVDYIKFAFQN